MKRAWLTYFWASRFLFGVATLANLCAAGCDKSQDSSTFGVSIAPLAEIPWDTRQRTTLLVRPDGPPGDGFLIVPLEAFPGDWWGVSKSAYRKMGIPESEVAKLDMPEETQTLSELVENPDVYRFRKGMDRFERSSLEEWNRTDTRICDTKGGCSLVFTDSTIELIRLQFQDDVVTKDHLLRKSGRVLKTAGRTALYIEHSPQQDLVAVLSSKGAYRYSIPTMPSGITAMIEGKRYHQLFENATGERVGKTIELLDTNANDLMSSFWTADQRFVIYYDLMEPKIWIVPIEARNQPTREGKGDR